MTHVAPGVGVRAHKFNKREKEAVVAASMPLYECHELLNKGNIIRSVLTQSKASTHKLPETRVQLGPENAKRRAQAVFIQVQRIPVACQQSTESIESMESHARLSSEGKSLLLIDRIENAVRLENVHECIRAKIYGLTQETEIIRVHDTVDEPVALPVRHHVRNSPACVPKDSQHRIVGRSFDQFHVDKMPAACSD
jgi:hypothetical protein